MRAEISDPPQQQQRPEASENIKNRNHAHDGCHNIEVNKEFEGASLLYIYECSTG